MQSPDYDRLSPRLPKKTHPLIKGEYLGDPSLKRNDVIDGPGRIIRRLSRRRREPPFLEEYFGGHGSSSSSLRGSDKRPRRTPQSRRRRMLSEHDRKSSPVPNILSSSDSVPSSAVGTMNFDFLHHLSVHSTTPRLSVSTGSDDATEVAVGDVEPAAMALKRMVSVSRNKECLATLVSYLCLPKFMDK